MSEPPGRVIRSDGFSYPEMVTAIERTGQRIVSLVRSIAVTISG